MTAAITLQEKMDLLREKALGALEEFIDLPVTDELGYIIRENAGPKLMAAKIIFSSQMPVSSSAQLPIPLLDLDAIQGNSIVFTNYADSSDPPSSSYDAQTISRN